MPDTVRHVRAGEADRLREIRLASLKADPDAFSSTYEREAAYPESWWTSRAALSDAGDEQRTFLVVDRDDRWLGMALARDDGGQAVLNAMWVAPPARGRGAGRALCDACADWAAERGFEALDVAVVPDNAPARRAYEAAAFAAHDRTDDELILRRPLEPRTAARRSPARARSTRKP